MEDPVEKPLRDAGRARPAPPPSPELLEAIAATEPVKARSPLRGLASVVIASLALMAVHLIAFRVRPDMPWLPAEWVASVAMAMLGAYVLTLAAVLVPPRGQVLPSAERAQYAAIGAAVVLLGLSIFTVDAPGHTAVIKPGLWPQLRAILHCMVNAIEMTAFPALLGFLVLRRAAPLRTRWLAAGLGAANGALAALVLHLHCNGGGVLHVSLGHAGNVVLLAALGAAFLPRFLEA
jgi:hypothetical protein